jgi:hypothetical protein
LLWGWLKFHYWGALSPHRYHETNDDKSLLPTLPSLLPSLSLSNSLLSLPKQNEIKMCNIADLGFFHHNGNGGKQGQQRPNEATTLVAIAVVLVLANAILATVNILK